MASNNPKISVIVPVYNAEKYLRRCIDSILAQTFTDFELLLIDDGSMDKSGKICDEYAKKDNRIRIFHKENGGVSSARNIGLDNAYGEWIAFADADDKVYSCWLENFIDEISKKADLIITSFTSNYKGAEKNVIVNENIGLENAILTLEAKESFGYLWCKCFKKNIIKIFDIRFNERFMIWEDALFIYEFVCRIKNIATSSKIGYYYFLPERNKYNRENKFDCCYKILQCLNQIFPNKDNTAFKRYTSVLFGCLLSFYKDKGLSKAVLSRLKLYKLLMKEIYDDSYIHPYLNKFICSSNTFVCHIMLGLIAVCLKYFRRI